MRDLLEQGVGIMIIGGVTAVGMLTRILLLCYYGGLGRACTRFWETKNKTIVPIREDLRKRGDEEQKIKNIAVYTEYRLSVGKICGIRVGNLEQTVLYSLLLIGTGSVSATLAGVLIDCGNRTMLEHLFVGSASVTGLFVLDIITGLREKKKRIRLRIRDYIENCYCGEEERAGVTEAGKRELHRKKKEKQEGKKNRREDKPKTAEKKKRGKAQEEKRRLTEELLRERRQLEARSLAEQRKKERAEAEAEMAERMPVENMVECMPADEEVTGGEFEQVQAEAAVTESPEEQVQAEVTENGIAESKKQTEHAKRSYEDLIMEFLKEYPA